MRHLKRTAAFLDRHRVAAAATVGSAVYFVGTQGVALATEYKVEYSKLTTAAETNFGEAITAVLVLLGLIIGVLLGIRVVKKMLRA